MNRHINRRTETLPNAFKPHSIEDYKIIYQYLTKKKKISELASALGRSRSAIYQMRTILQFALRHSKEELVQLLTAHRSSKASASGLFDFLDYLESEATNKQIAFLKQPFNNKIVDEINAAKPSDLDSKIQLLDDELNKLKTTIIEVIDLSVKQKVLNHQKEKDNRIETLEKELAAYRKSMEEAKESNWLETLRRKLSLTDN